MAAISLQPKGLSFVRSVKALALTKGKMIDAACYAEEVHGFGSEPARILRAAAVAGGLDPSGTWGDELGTFRNASAEFFELVAQRSAVGRLAGVRKVPFNTKIVAPTTGTTAGWVAEGKAKSVRQMVFASTSLPPLKVSATCVITLELLRNSDVRTETWLRDDLSRALAKVIDESFLDASAGVTGVEPASILNGITPITGTAVPATDIKALLLGFDGDLSTSFFVMSPFAAAQVSGVEYPNVGARGGDIAGVEVITTGNMPAGVVALIDATGIAIAEGDASVRISTQGSLQMDDAPTQSSVTTATATSVVSLWQTDSIGILVEKSTNWTRLRTGAAKHISGATWATP